MKKLISGILILVLLMMLTGCGTNTEELNSKIKELEANISKLNEEKDNLSKEITTLKDDKKKTEEKLKVVQKEYDEYKDEMKPYEELSQAEAEARKIEADRVAEEKRQEEAAAKEEAERLAAEEEAKGYETGITYQDIARTPDEYKNKKIKFSGKVVQLIEGRHENQLRVAIDSDYDQIILLSYAPSIVNQRVLENDIITFMGKSVGTITYESTMGKKITIPAATADIIEFN